MKSKNNEIPIPGDVRYLQDTLYVISGKWKLPILYSLANEKMKFKELQRSIPKITAKMLTKELKDLELNGFIKRKPVSQFTKITDYEVTDYCKSFGTIIIEMIKWGKEHRDAITKGKLSF